jgi:membrane-bound ClpP family serine protease
MRGEEGLMSVLFWPSLFLALGLLLLLIEVFIPSGGLIGLCSLLCLALSLWYAFSQSLSMGATFMLVDLVAVPLTAAAAFSLWSRSPLGRKFFLAPPNREEIEVSHAEHHLDRLVGLEGQTLTPLRPSGTVEIEGRRLGSLAEEGYLPAGTSVRVMRVRSGQLIVRGLLDPAHGASDNDPDKIDPSGPQTGPSTISRTALAVSITEDPP